MARWHGDTSRTTAVKKLGHANASCRSLSDVPTGDRMNAMRATLPSCRLGWPSRELSWANRLPLSSVGVVVIADRGEPVLSVVEVSSRACGNAVSASMAACSSAPRAAMVLTRTVAAWSVSTPSGRLGQFFKNGQIGWDLTLTAAAIRRRSTAQPRSSARGQLVVALTRDGRFRGRGRVLRLRPQAARSRQLRTGTAAQPGDAEHP